MDRNGPQFPPELSDRQVSALPYLAAAATNEEGARMAEISITTLKRWRQDSVFRDELRRLREDAASLAHTELNGLALKSMGALASLLEDPNPRVRAQAVRIALDTGGQGGRECKKHPSPQPASEGPHPAQEREVRRLSCPTAWTHSNATSSASSRR